MSTLVLFLVIGLLFLATFLFTFTRGDKDPACVQTSNSGFHFVKLTLNTLTLVVISLHTVLFKFAMSGKENLFENQELLKLAITSLTLMTFTFDSRLTGVQVSESVQAPTSYHVISACESPPL